MEHNDQDCEDLFRECPDIIKKLEIIESEMKGSQLEYLNSLQLVSKHDKKSLTFAEIKLFLQTFISLKDFKVIQYFN